MLLKGHRKELGLSRIRWREEWETREECRLPCKGGLECHAEQLGRVQRLRNFIPQTHTACVQIPPVTCVVLGDVPNFFPLE